MTSHPLATARRSGVRPKIEGLVAAPFTPMRADGALNLDAVEPYAAWLAERGVAGAFVCGTTGEGMSLTVDERIAVADSWSRVIPPGFRLIVHVGHTSLADCRRLAAHAQEIGADSIGCMPPFFFKPDSMAATADWCAQVADAAPELPFYYYHIPSMSGVAFSIAEFLAVEGGTIPQLAGVKYTHEDLRDFTAAGQVGGGKFDVLFGRDELLQQGLAAGARGAVGSTYNFASPLYRELMRCAASGAQDEAKRLQGKAVAMIQAILQAGGSGVACLKATMKLAGFDCGPARRPMTNPGTDKIAGLQRKLSELGIDRLCDWKIPGQI